MMKKLTAEVARMELANLKAMKENTSFGISIKAELFMQALEIALPVLEQQEKGERSWLHWNGEMALPPVRGDVRVEIKRRNGEVIERQSKWFAWRNSPVKSEFDIIAYRVIENDGREG